MRSDLVQILSSCPACRVEAAVVELVEVGRIDSIVVEGRCRMCGRLEEDGQVRFPGQRFASDEQVLAALARWAAEDGESDVRLFLESGFGGLDLPGLTRALVEGRPVETSFDVIAWLFPGMGAGAGAAQAEPEQVARALEQGPRAGGGVLHRTAASGDAPTEMSGRLGAWDAPAPGGSADPEPEPADDLHVAVQALVAVMLADGVIRPGERRFLDGFLARAGLPPLPDDELRARRPPELPRPARPEPILRAMIDLAYIDMERDGSEWAVVREYARHWGFPLDELERLGERKEEQLASAMTRLWRSLRRLLFVEEAS